MKTARLRVIRSPHGDGAVIAWDGKTIASSLIAGLAAEALNKARNRAYFLKYFEEASPPDAVDHTVHSGNGLNLMAFEKFGFLDHD